MPAQISRRQLLGGAAASAGLLLLRTPGAWAAPPVAPRVGYGPDAARMLRLSWSTPGPVGSLRAEVGRDRRLGRIVDVETRAVAGSPVRYHHTLIDGLDPGTAYSYRLSHAGGAVAGSVSTAPTDPVPFTFVAFGDQGDGADAATVDAVVRRAAPDVVFVVGDLSYASKTGGLTPNLPGLIPPTVDHAVWDRWLGLVSGAGGASTPWLAGVGNHEIEDGQGELGYDGYLARVPLPGNGPDGVPTAWTARHGTVAFVNLDANDVSYEITRNRGFTGGAQTAWLSRTLRGLRRDPGVDWIVVGYHHCSFCSNAVHGSDGGVREAWHSLFDRHQVDLVVNGHNHCYERAHPMRAGAVVDEVPAGARWDSAKGTTYITAGGGGQAAYPTFVPGVSYVNTDLALKLPELATWSAVTNAVTSVLVVDVVPAGSDGLTQLRLRAVSGTGAVIDRLTLTRKVAARAARPVQVVPKTG